MGRSARASRGKELVSTEPQLAEPGWLEGDEWKGLYRLAAGGVLGVRSLCSSKARTSSLFRTKSQEETPRRKKIVQTKASTSTCTPVVTRTPLIKSSFHQSPHSPPSPPCLMQPNLHPIPRPHRKPQPLPHPPRDPLIHRLHPIIPQQHPHN